MLRTPLPHGNVTYDIYARGVIYASRCHQWRTSSKPDAIIVGCLPLQAGWPHAIVPPRISSLR
jgi:hypothetical protein